MGRLAKEKNIELLLQAHENLIKKNKNIKLVVIGSGPDLEHFIKWTVDKKLEKNIIFTNAIPWDEIPTYYQIADVFATASVTETQGLTVIEAMSASKPVICINDDAFLDVVVDDLNGKIFETQEEYESIILDLFTNTKKLEQMSRQARYTAENHSLKYFALNILSVYESCLKKEDLKQSWFDKLIGKFKKRKKN